MPNYPSLTYIRIAWLAHVTTGHSNDYFPLSLLLWRFYLLFQITSGVYNATVISPLITNTHTLHDIFLLHFQVSNLPALTKCVYTSMTLMTDRQANIITPSLQFQTYMFSIPNCLLLFGLLPHYCIISQSHSVLCVSANYVHQLHIVMVQLIISSDRFSF